MLESIFEGTLRDIFEETDTFRQNKHDFIKEGRNKNDVLSWQTFWSRGSLEQEIITYKFILMTDANVEMYKLLCAIKSKLMHYCEVCHYLVWS